ncbi:hypothetical protein EDB83DRAFT_2385203 [Lactarius deliciosus]|nr:hypothetical protein EDB83DRAFT_2385203 [Lactarius deliciosus]
MPSRSLIPSQTAVSIHLGTRILPSPHEASSRETSVSHRHLSFLRHMNGFWKGTLYFTAARCDLSSIQGFALRSKKQLTSGRIKSGPMLVSEPTPGPPHHAFSPSSPALQTPVSLPCDDEESDDWPWITVSGADSLYPDLSRASVGPFPKPCRRHRVSLSENSGLSYMASTSPVIGASGSILDAATRLQDFRSLILEMRASLLDHDHETAVDVRERDEEEIESLLRLLEDVMRKVRGLAERDIPDLGLPVIKIDVAP